MYDYQAIIEKTETQWDLTEPMPKPQGGWLTCGACGSQDEFIIRNASYTSKPEEYSPYPYRLDVSVKCGNCGHVWMHGLIISQQVWEKHYQATGGNLTRWKYRRSLGEA